MLLYVIHKSGLIINLLLKLKFIFYSKFYIIELTISLFVNSSSKRYE